MTEAHCWDVAIVGARCAGASTALLLARAGHRVVVVDRAVFPSDTLSTHALARGGVAQLARWGLLGRVLHSGAPAVRQVVFRAGDHEDVRDLKQRAGVDLLVAPRRHILDAILAGAAAEAGAELRFGRAATGVLRDAAERVNGLLIADGNGTPVPLRARFVVGADGVRSRAARWLGADVLEHHPADNATFYAHVGGLDLRGYEFHVADGAVAGVFPTHGEVGCVWVCSSGAAADAVRRAGERRREAFTELLAAVTPALATRVREGQMVSPVRGVIGLPNQVRRASGPGWALVGDAGYHRDPVTGHGMTDAFRDAELLARALDQALRGHVAEDVALAEYGHRRDAALRPTFDITCAMTAYPRANALVALQKQLSRALDDEASALAATPAWPVPLRRSAAA